MAVTSLDNEAVAIGEWAVVLWRRLGCACPFYTFSWP